MSYMQWSCQIWSWLGKTRQENTRFGFIFPVKFRVTKTGINVLGLMEVIIMQSLRSEIVTEKQPGLTFEVFTKSGNMSATSLKCILNNHCLSLPISNAHQSHKTHFLHNCFNKWCSNHTMSELDWTKKVTRETQLAVKYISDISATLKVSQGHKILEWECKRSYTAHKLLLAIYVETPRGIPVPAFLQRQINTLHHND